MLANINVELAKRDIGCLSCALGTVGLVCLVVSVICLSHISTFYSDRTYGCLLGGVLSLVIVADVIKNVSDKFAERRKLLRRGFGETRDTITSLSASEADELKGKLKNNEHFIYHDMGSNRVYIMHPSGPDLVSSDQQLVRLGGFNNERVRVEDLGEV